MQKAASDIVVVKQPASANSPSQPRGYLAAYQQDPKGFQSDAKLFDAWLIATQLATSALQHSARGNWILSSSEVDYVQPDKRIDPWSHTFCLLRREDTVLVISAGPSATGSPSCKDVQIGADELNSLAHGKLLQSPSGSLVLVINKQQSQEIAARPDALLAIRRS
jgi:hypothetical protein